MGTIPLVIHCIYLEKPWYLLPRLTNFAPAWMFSEHYIFVRYREFFFTVLNGLVRKWKAELTQWNSKNKARSRELSKYKKSKPEGNERKRGVALGNPPPPWCVLIAYLPRSVKWGKLFVEFTRLRVGVFCGC